jgi:hypothetical protein
VSKGFGKKDAGGKRAATYNLPKTISGIATIFTLWIDSIKIRLFMIFC